MRDGFADDGQHGNSAKNVRGATRLSQQNAWEFVRCRARVKLAIPRPRFGHLKHGVRKVLMKAVLLYSYGGPEQLRYEETDMPQYGDNEVLVRVRATSINPIDVKIRSGAAKSRVPIEFPAILGRDLSGEVFG